MIRSICSTFKEVVHIVPVRKIKAEDLFQIIKKVIIGLHEIGFTVLCVSSDNNAVNGKAMSYFANPPALQTSYHHPFFKTSDPNRIPLFFIFDTVHILKCVKNNWINHKNQCLNYPEFFPNASDGTVVIQTASFSDLKEIHRLEEKQLVKYGQTLTKKSLSPTSQERQNVKLVLKIFNDYIHQALLHYKKNNTAEFIRIITDWWSIVNVKSMFKGVRRRNELENPLTMDGVNFLHLKQIYRWLELWICVKNQCKSLNTFTRETQTAIHHSTKGLIEMTEFCITKLNFSYFLPGKIQTDCLEDRFGKYRDWAGSQYLISIRQLYEVESKMRLQRLLPVNHKLKSFSYGSFNIENLENIENVTFDDGIENVICDDDVVHQEACSFDLTFDATETLIDDDFNELLPVFTYIGGYCIRSALSKLKCQDCNDFVILKKNEDSMQMPNHSLIIGLDRGGLLFPHFDVVLVVSIAYTIMQQLISKENEKKFLTITNQRKLLVYFIVYAANSEIDFLYGSSCSKSEHINIILARIAGTIANIFINNYVKNKNDVLSSQVQGKNRKLQTVMKENPQTNSNQVKKVEPTDDVKEKKKICRRAPLQPLEINKQKKIKIGTWKKLNRRNT